MRKEDKSVLVIATTTIKVTSKYKIKKIVNLHNSIEYKEYNHSKPWNLNLEKAVSSKFNGILYISKSNKIDKKTKKKIIGLTILFFLKSSLDASKDT